MPSQFPALRLIFARQMEAYRERIAQRIREEATRHGESPVDVAQALGVYPTTAERWMRGERTPQRRHRQDLARHWDLPFEDLEPSLSVEEDKVRKQLNRIERKLDKAVKFAEEGAELLSRLQRIETAMGVEQPPALDVEELEQDEEAVARQSESSDQPTEERERGAASQ